MLEHSPPAEVRVAAVLNDRLLLLKKHSGLIQNVTCVNLGGEHTSFLTPPRSCTVRITITTSHKFTKRNS